MGRTAAGDLTLQACDAVIPAFRPLLCGRWPGRDRIGTPSEPGAVPAEHRCARDLELKLVR